MSGASDGQWQFVEAQRLFDALFDPSPCTVVENVVVRCGEVFRRGPGDQRFNLADHFSVQRIDRVELQFFPAAQPVKSQGRFLKPAG